MPPPPRKRRRVIHASPRLARELNGTRQALPPASALLSSHLESLPRLKISDFDPFHELRNYIILGESPLPPHNLVSVRKLSFSTFPASPCVVYWSLNPPLSYLSNSSQSPSHWHSNPPRIEFSRAITYPIVAADAAAERIFTALTTDPKDPVLHQVLVYDEHVELRAGGQILHFPVVEENGMGETHTAVCFAHIVNGSEGGGPGGGVVKILHDGVLYLYTPHALCSSGADQQQQQQQPLFSTPPNTTISYLPSTPLSSRHIPHLVRASLPHITALFLARSPAFRKLLGPGTRPRLRKNTIHTVFLPTKWPERTKAGTQGMGPMGRCVIAFGAVEDATGVYHLLLFKLEDPKWRLEVAAARCLKFPGVAGRGKKREARDAAIGAAGGDGENGDSEHGEDRRSNDNNDNDNEDDDNDDDDNTNDDSSNGAKWSAASMLALALQRVLANTSSTTTSSDITEKLGLHPRGGHDCRKECFGGDTGQEVSVLTSWERGKRSIPKLVCPGLGVVLESWRKPDGVGLLEDVEDDDGRGEDDEWGVW